MLKNSSGNAATAKFIELFNEFFDCLNVGNYTSEVIQQQYTFCNDFHFMVYGHFYIQTSHNTCNFFAQRLEHTFLKYLAHWKTAVDRRPDFTETGTTRAWSLPSARVWAFRWQWIAWRAIASVLTWTTGRLHLPVEKLAQLRSMLPQLSVR